MSNEVITVFTPTYNRGYIINKCYESLCRQTNNNFEWLIVDDGSTDDTESIVNEWIKENKIKIRYVKQKNAGKYIAHNRGVLECNTGIFVCVDSDDYLTNDALEKINKWESELDKNKKFAGIVANLGSNGHKTINNFFKEEYLDLSLLERYSYCEDNKKVLDGERAFIFYTEVHRKYKYPEFEGEKFMTEAVTWNRMANDGYIVRYFNDIICIYEYLEDGLTKAGNKLFLENPRGYGLWLKEKAIFEKKSYFEMIKLYYSYYCELYKLYSMNKIAEYIVISKFKLMLIAMLKKIKSI